MPDEPKHDEHKKSGPVAPTRGGAELNRGGRDTGTPMPVGAGSAEIARKDGGRIAVEDGDELLGQVDDESGKPK